MLHDMNDKPISLVDAKTWKGLNAEDRATVGVVKAHVSRPKTVKQSGEETERLLSWIVSTAGRDRDGDRIMQAGWELDNFRANPVVMLGHDYGTLPIGRALETEVVGEGDEAVLRMVKQFTPKDLNPMGFMVYEMARDDYLRTASVGFIIKKATPDPELPEEERGMFGGFLLEAQELLESSVVPIPANPGALIEARSVGGIDTTPYIAWAERLLDAAQSPASPFSREQVEAIHRATAPDQRFFDMGRGRKAISVVSGSAVSWDAAHPKGQAVAAIGPEWDEKAQRSEVEDRDDLPIMAAWKTSYEYMLLHHEGKTLDLSPPGLMHAMESLLQVKKADRNDQWKAAHAHLVRHYEQDLKMPAPIAIVDWAKAMRNMRERMAETKSAITWGESHPDGTPVADRDVEWDGPVQVAEADVEDLMVMSAWVDSEDPDIKGSYKLPHHMAEGEHTLVWRGLIAAMGALLGARGGVDIPDADRQAVYDHLARHYRDDFEEEPPEFRAGHRDDEDHDSGHEDEDEDEDDKAPSSIEVKDGAVYLDGRKIQRCQRVTVTPGKDGATVVTLELTPTTINIESSAKPVIGNADTPDNVINLETASQSDISRLIAEAFQPKADA